jgi:hypothetical protein
MSRDKQARRRKFYFVTAKAVNGALARGMRVLNLPDEDEPRKVEAYLVDAGWGASSSPCSPPVGGLTLTLESQLDDVVDVDSMPEQTTPKPKQKFDDNPFTSPEAAYKAGSGPVADVAKKINDAAANGGRTFKVTIGLANRVARDLRAQGWKVTVKPCVNSVQEPHDETQSRMLFLWAEFDDIEPEPEPEPEPEAPAAEPG